MEVTTFARFKAADPVSIIFYSSSSSVPTGAQGTDEGGAGQTIDYRANGLRQPVQAGHIM
ncbi:hypothetical protein GCM10011588_23220 [Nocardia jinanensis]|uniref:Uncharacterized protein n=1 Tax=Nocardia jinanensis TaxID=382504 RepID=A0A917RHD2_9NOCA|nr:hypothetical protein GCM10011588_23220 [Nocardia jinanensis]